MNVIHKYKKKILKNYILNNIFIQSEIEQNEDYDFQTTNINIYLKYKQNTFVFNIIY